LPGVKLCCAVGQQQFGFLRSKQGEDIGWEAILTDNDVKIVQSGMAGKESLLEFTFIGEEDFFAVRRAAALA
jgi:hypothetical protein